ncbi:MAG: SGNH/GDSL hydrolase family protein [Paracoccaceae bacterium]
MKTMAIASVALLTLLSSNAFAATTNLISFGDSLVDSGNIAAVQGDAFPSSVYPNGQFTNGDTWATQLGLAPSLLGGSNFAYGGARAVGNGDAIPDLFDQFREYHLSDYVSRENTVATIWMGGNDFLALDDNATQAEALETIGAVIGKISAGVTHLYSSGISTVMVLGLPDFGLLPNNASDPVLAATASGLTAAYNAGLEAALNALDAGLPGSDVRYFDTNSLFMEVVAQVPAELISVPCLTDPAGCAANPTDYVFYDDIHPTEWVHTVLAEAIAEELDLDVAAVPLPATAPLLLFGLGGAAVMLRRRKSRA